VFDGWYFETECTTPIGTELATETDTLYAKWTAHDVAPTSTVVHTLAEKKIVYTFSEEVMLITGNDLWEGYPGAIIRVPHIDNLLFHLYELDASYEYVLTGGVAVPVAGVTISELTWNTAGTVATFTYTGTIPVSASGHYVIDCMGYTITDVAGVEHAVGVASTFDVTE